MRTPNPGRTLFFLVACGLRAASAWAQGRPEVTASGVDGGAGAAAVDVVRQQELATLPGSALVQAGHYTGVEIPILVLIALLFLLGLCVLAFRQAGLAARLKDQEIKIRNLRSEIERLMAHPVSAGRVERRQEGVLQVPAAAHPERAAVGGAGPAQRGGEMPSQAAHATQASKSPTTQSRRGAYPDLYLAPDPIAGVNLNDEAFRALSSMDETVPIVEAPRLSMTASPPPAARVEAASILYDEDVLPAAWRVFITSDEGNNQGDLEYLRKLLQGRLTGKLVAVQSHPENPSLALVTVRQPSGEEEIHGLPLSLSYLNVTAYFDLADRNRAAFQKIADLRRTAHFLPHSLTPHELGIVVL